MRTTRNRMRPASSRITLVAGTILLVGSAAVAARAGGADYGLDPGRDSIAADTALPTLLAAMRGTHETPCRLAAAALSGRYGSGPGWEADVLSDAHVVVLESRNLGPAALPVLREALSGSDPCVRRTAIVLFGRLRADGAADALRPLLASSDVNVREAAVLALGHREAREDAGAVRPALRDDAPQVRRAAAWSLGRMEDRGSVAALIEALRDREPTVRAQAAYALGSIEDPSAVPAIAAMLNGDADPRVRRVAARALGQFD